MTRAAVAWELSGDSSTIRIIIQKEESALTVGFFLKEELIRSSLNEDNYIRYRLSRVSALSLIKGIHHQIPNFFSGGQIRGNLTASMGTISEIYQDNLQNQKGFTLLEIMAVIVIIGILASTTVHRFGRLSDMAGQKLLAAGIRELNIRETLVWTQFKISDTGWPGDDGIFSRVKTDLGKKYYWNPAVNKNGGSLHFESQSINLVRTPSKVGSAGRWQ